MVNAAPPEAAPPRIAHHTRGRRYTSNTAVYHLFTPCWRRTEHGCFLEPRNEELAVTVEPYGRPAIYVYLI